MSQKPVPMCPVCGLPLRVCRLFFAAFLAIVVGGGGVLMFFLVQLGET